MKKSHITTYNCCTDSSICNICHYVNNVSIELHQLCRPAYNNKYMTNYYISSSANVVNAYRLIQFKKALKTSPYNEATDYLSDFGERNFHMLANENPDFIKDVKILLDTEIKLCMIVVEKNNKIMLEFHKMLDYFKTQNNENNTTLHINEKAQLNLLIENLNLLQEFPSVTTLHFKNIEHLPKSYDEIKRLPGFTLNDIRKYIEINGLDEGIKIFSLFNERKIIKLIIENCNILIDVDNLRNINNRNQISIKAFNSFIKINKLDDEASSEEKKKYNDDKLVFRIINI